MERSWLAIALIAACVPFFILAAPIDDASSTGDKEKRHFNSKPTPFSGVLHNQAGLQSWNDWLNKRNFGETPFGYANLQNWKNWMDKRGSMISSRNFPTFGGEFGKNPALQSWDNWWQKRGLTDNQKAVLEGPGFMNKFGLQNWNNWGGKRSMATGPNSFKDFYNGNLGLQSWEDFAKKSNFGKQDPLGLGGLQPWHMYSKRFGGPNSPFSSFDPHKGLMKWDEVFKRGADTKRPSMGMGTKSFGQYQNYFTNGLQDWRNTFQKAKRSSGDAHVSKSESD